jgi:predicted nucleic acid-binding protein
MELSAGARSLHDRKVLDTLFSAFRRAGRILVPAVSVYEEAGEVVRLLQTKRDYNLQGAFSLANDVLIALSARSIGATVQTQNWTDFEAIRAVRPFRLAIVA